ncbi:uncharacterized protein [Procambarus clarkii]|uniref:uncharacterized protein n=1 Tax=Procambarus clarkii TaxID=6728 RepID=UPI003743BAE2
MSFVKEQIAERHRRVERSELKEFKGCLSGDGLAALPPSLEQLSLALVDDDQARNLLPQLHAAVTSRLPRLWLLEVRVAARVTPAALVPLPRPQQVTPAAPGTRGVWLELSDVSDAGVSRACHVASLLQPPGGYGTISYPGATMTAAGCEDMIRDLRHHRVKVEQFVVPRAIPLSDHQLDHLITLARTMRGSYFWRLQVALRFLHYELTSLWGMTLPSQSGQHQLTTTLPRPYPPFF